MSKLELKGKMTPAQIKAAIVTHFSVMDSYFIRQDRMAVTVLLPYRNVSVEEVTGTMSKEFRELVTVYPVELGCSSGFIIDVLTEEKKPLKGVYIGIKK